LTCPFAHRRPCHAAKVERHIVCQHRVEIEVWPSEAEVYFRDEQHVDPVNTQVRFDAVVYNAPSSGVTWKVQDVSGGPGKGSIDPTGLYVAPPKGSLPHGTTDIVVATAADEPLRKAFARVTLVGVGPEPLPDPILELYPKQAYAYYRFNRPTSDDHNEYIDISNKLQLFRALIRNSDSDQVEWYVDMGSGYGSPVGQLEPWYVYMVPSTGDSGWEVKIKAQLKDHPGVYDEAKVILINYKWPGIV
jgi:hypothetical protein